MENHRRAVGDMLHNIVPAGNQVTDFDGNGSGLLHFPDMLLQGLRPGLGFQNLLVKGLLLLKTAGDQNGLKSQQRKESNPEEDRPPGDPAEGGAQTGAGGRGRLPPLGLPGGRAGGKPDPGRSVGSAAAGGALLALAVTAKTGFTHEPASSSGSRSGRFRSTISRMTASAPRPEKASAE